MKVAVRVWLAIVALGVLPLQASAADGASVKNWKAPAPYYKDLPGVVPHQSLVGGTDSSDDNCTTATEYRRWSRRDTFPDFPVRVFRCEKNGITFSGSEMPNRPWVPGLNPYDLPKD